MAFSPRYSVPASNLLTAVKAISRRHHIAKNSIIHLSLCLLFARCIDIEWQQGQKFGLSAGVYGSKDAVVKLVNTWHRFNQPDITDREQLSLFIDFYQSLTRLFRGLVGHHLNESGDLTGKLLREVLAETALPKAQPRDAEDAFAMIRAAYDHLFYALHDDMSKHAERVFARLLQGLSVGNMPLMREWPLVSGEIVLDDEPESNAAGRRQPLLSASEEDMPLVLQMRLALHRVEQTLSRETDLGLYRNANAPLQLNGASVMHTLTTSTFEIPFVALVVMQSLPTRIDFDALMNSNRLLAVIEFNAQQKKNHRLCLLSNRLPFRDVLMINTTRLDQAQNLNAAVQAGLIGATLSACFNLPWQKLRGTRQDDEQIDALKTRFFRRGYEDIAGYCHLIPHEKIQQIKQLRPEAWIKPPQANNTFNGLNMEAIYPQLIADDKKRCHYIIGNNGVGKSFLLRDIAQTLHDSNLDTRNNGKKIPVLMAAFGYADRFADLSVIAEGGLRYLGDLHNMQTVALKKREAEVAKRILAIYRHAQKRSVLIELLNEFSFNTDVYFLPPDYVLKNGELYSDKEIHNISFIAPDNLIGLEQIKGHVLAFEKQGEPTTLYTSLSSGEQHILLMLLRILSALETGSVVLVDEPELSLHVEWQQRLPAAFSTLCDRYNASFVVATHSPVLIAAVDHHHSVCYLAKPGLLTAIEPDAMTNIEATLLDAFNIVTRNNRSIYEHCASAVSGFMQAINQGDNVNIAKEKAFATLIQLREKLQAHPVAIDNHGSDIKLLDQAINAINELADAARLEADDGTSV